MNKTELTTTSENLQQSAHLDHNRVQQLAETLDIADTNSILNFGAAAQKQLTAVADTMLTDIKGEDAGKAGELLSNMVLLLRGFQGAELKTQEKPSFFSRLFGKVKPLQTFLQKFDTVSEQIDQISNALETHKQKLLVDIKSLDKLYDANLDYYRELEYHIAAAETVLQQTDQTVLPTLKEAAEDGQMESAQRLRDRQMQRDELDRRLHDLRLTKQVSMQALPSIRLVQENNKGLVSKINTTLVNTVPLWRQQLAQSIAIFRSGEAAIALKQSSDLTNELLTTNAENLKIANRESRAQLERGVFDISSVEQANKMLIETIEESIQIHENGRKQRQEAALKLQAAEDALKQSLKAAAQTPGQGNQPGSNR
ncbi:MAG: toxic anion resistance protein [Cardiobacteriaceae bacterium]|nr:toxic anion resistance protein [Cardiobacteriaceae bacterium]